MASKFVGGDEIVILNAATLSAPQISAVFELKAEFYEFEITVDKAATVIIRTGDAISGSPANTALTFVHPGSGTLKKLVSLGGQPNGRQVFAQVTTGSSVELTVTARETRSGLG